MQGHVQAIGIAGFSQQGGGGSRVARGRLGLSQELLGEGRTDGRVLAYCAEAKLHAFPDGGPVGRQFEGLADAIIIAGWTVGADVAGVEAEIAAEVQEAGIVEPEDAVGRAAC